MVWSVPSQEEGVINVPLELKTMPASPMGMVKQWMNQAYVGVGKTAYVAAMATADIDSNPSVRFMKCNDIESDGLLFYGPGGSYLFRNLKDNPCVEVGFYWPTLQRSLRLYGQIEFASEDEMEEVFAKFPRDEQIAAWVSKSGLKAKTKEEQTKEYLSYQEKFKGKPIPLPANWKLFKVVPTRVIFWQSAPNHVDDEVIYERVDDGSGWQSAPQWEKSYVLL